MKSNLKFLFIYLFLYFQIGYTNHFITFIIPCYNCEQWIEEAVGSIYQQNLPYPFEIICTNDGSSDQTYEKLLSLGKNHPEILIFKHEKNKGGGAARNTCVYYSKGDLIFCLDSDNILEPNSIKKLITHLDQTQSDIVSFGSPQYFKNHFEKIKSIKYSTKNCEFTLSDILQHDNSPPWSGNYLYTRKSYDLVGGYPEKWGAVDTFSFGFLQLLHHCKMTYVPDTFYWHRQTPDSYYVRDLNSNKINIYFFKLMIKNKKIFTDKTINIIKKNLDLALN